MSVLFCFLFCFFVSFLVSGFFLWVGGVGVLFFFFLDFDFTACVILPCLDSRWVEVRSLEIICER